MFQKRWKKYLKMKYHNFDLKNNDLLILGAGQ